MQLLSILKAETAVFLPVRTYLTLFLVVGLAFFVSSCNQGHSKNDEKNKIPQIPVLELQPQSIEIPQNYICEIQAVQFVEVRAKVEGFVDRIYVDEGEFVTKGKPLFQLTSMEFNEMVNGANARLMQARAEAKAANLEVERLKVLVDKDIITASELELAKSKRAVAESAIAEAESTLKNAQTGLSYTTIRAPFDGIVDRIPFKTGSLVTAGDLLTNITDISEIFAYYKINENEYLNYMRKKIKEEGEDQVIEDLTLILSDGTTYAHKGHLETMEADFERGTGSIAFRVRFPNPNSLLKHGASGKIQMTNQLEDVYLIPQKSTFEIQDFSYVYVVDSENTVKVRSFKPLKRHDVFYAAQGFNPGDRIIFEGIQQVKDGVKILPDQVSAQDAYGEFMSKLEEGQE
ncbi:efflux RND transporter periplasmic adaptor subunit [Litoribacter populi]|uniref:efflux RND transporter periplasmic adaptor subunit n=1 Tax=Litoribacter populi TaxID=2598460 RepID=UPI0011815771|nr:efflux RND transporter periplasmic adaptor subunit [Litoribacter populi]